MSARVKYPSMHLLLQVLLGFSQSEAEPEGMA
jgi:hypothetical protein